MGRNSNLSSLDTDQIVKKVFQEDLDAQRVVLVGNEKMELSVDSDKLSSAISNAIKDSLKDVKFEQTTVPQLISAPYIEEKAEPIIIPIREIEKIEIPVIIKETEIRTIEVPVIIEKIVTVEKPIIIKETEFKEVYREKEFPKWHKICMFLQTAAVFGILLSHILK